MSINAWRKESSPFLDERLVYLAIEMSIADSLLHESLSNESMVIIEMRFTTCRMDMILVMLLCQRYNKMSTT